MRVRLGAAAMLVLFVLTGCSHSSTDNQSPPSVSTTTEEVGAESRASATGGPANVSVPDPCVLITKEDATKVIGETDASTISPGGLPGERSCGYAAGASGKLVTVAVFPADQAAFDKLKTTAGTTTAVSGFGDAAFSTSNALYAHKGQLAVGIFVAGVTPDSATTTALSTLMTTALGRM